MTYTALQKKASTGIMYLCINVIVNCAIKGMVFHLGFCIGISYFLHTIAIHYIEGILPAKV